jgi:hypothetical protein
MKAKDLRFGSVWQYPGEPNRIHYTLIQPRAIRRLYADRGTALFTLLEKHLSIGV